MEGTNPAKKDKVETPQAGPRRTILRLGVQSPARQDRRLVLGACLFRRPETQHPRAQSGQRQEREHFAAVADPRHEKRAASRSRAGGRHRGPDRLAAFHHRRHAVRHPAPDSAGSDPVSGDGHLDGHRAGHGHGTRKAQRHPGDAQAPGSHAAGDQRRNGTDADQRHGRVAPGGDQEPLAPRFQPQGQVPQTAGELPGDRPAPRGSHRRVPSSDRRAAVVCGTADSHGAVCPRRAACDRAEFLSAGDSARSLPDRCRRGTQDLRRGRRPDCGLPLDEAQGFRSGRQSQRGALQRNGLPHRRQ